MDAPQPTPEEIAEREESRKRLAEQVEAFAKKYPQGFDAAAAAALEKRTIKDREDLATAAAPSEIIKREGVCVTCKKPFQQSVIMMNGEPLLTAQNCEPCVAAYNERQAGDDEATKGQSLRQRWDDICPPDYQDTEISRLTRQCAEKLLTLQVRPSRVIHLDEILRHKHTDRGLALIGRTGECKTRIMLELLRRYHFAGVKVRYINAVNFADDLAASYGGDAGSAERWMKAIERAPILLIDDLGKEKLTERVESTYYRIVEFRKGHKLPLYFTGNMNGDDLIEKWQRNAQAQGFWSDRAEPIVRRLREMTDSITIKPR